MNRAPLRTGSPLLSLQVLEANAAAPQDQQLSASDILLNSQLLSELLADVSAEEGQLLSEAPRTSQEQQVQAKRLKALCWDAFEVKRAVCTGLKSGDVQVWNFQLPVQDDSAWAQVGSKQKQAAAWQGHMNTWLGYDQPYHAVPSPPPSIHAGM